MSDTYEILAVKYGEMLNRTRADNFMMPDDHAAPMPIDYFLFVVRNQDRTILIDTGFDHAEAKVRGRKLTLEPHEALKRIGIDPEKVPDVVITHLHYDHAGTMGDFKAAKFHIQDKEVAYATGRCMCEASMRMPFTADHVCTLVKNVFSGRVAFHDGDGEIAPGVTVHHCPGHSKGLQSIRVKTQSGYVVLASDAVHFYENIEKRKPFFITIDMDATLRTYTRLEAMATSTRHVVPGHDPQILKRYPAWKPETAGFVHRLDVPRIG